MSAHMRFLFIYFLFLFLSISIFSFDFYILSIIEHTRCFKIHSINKFTIHIICDKRLWFAFNDNVYTPMIVITIIIMYVFMRWREHDILFLPLFTYKFSPNEIDRQDLRDNLIVMQLEFHCTPWMHIQFMYDKYCICIHATIHKTTSVLSLLYKMYIICLFVCFVHYFLRYCSNVFWLLLCCHC